MDKPILVVPYTNPDIDGAAAAIAYAEFLNNMQQPARAAVFDEPHPEAKFVLNFINAEIPFAPANYSDFEQIVIVDHSDRYGFPKELDPNKVVEIIDHHKYQELDYFPNAKIQIELIGAAATLVAERIFARGLKPSQKSAALLYAAIVSNTLNFKARVTHERDIKMAKWLKPQAQLPDTFIHDMFAAKSDLSGDKLLQTMREDSAGYNIAGKSVATLQLEIVDSEQLVSNRLEEIIAELVKLKKDTSLDYIFLTIVDLDGGYNYFVCPDEGYQKIISEVLNVKFNNRVAKHDGLLLRKEIVPLLKEYFENHA